MNKKIAIVILVILGLFAVMGCTASGNIDTNSASANAAVTQPGALVANSSIQKISDVKLAENVGKTVTVQGEVINTLQSGIGTGYKIQDSNGTIDVSSSKIPALHSIVTVTGKLRQSTYFGIVIDEAS